MARSPSPVRDFPFYDGEPVRIGVGGWLLALVFTAAGFAALIGLPTLSAD